jgi:hypothetical protein
LVEEEVEEEEALVLEEEALEVEVEAVLVPLQEQLALALVDERRQRCLPYRSTHD